MQKGQNGTEWFGRKVGHESMDIGTLDLGSGIGIGEKSGKHFVAPCEN